MEKINGLIQRLRNRELKAFSDYKDLSVEEKLIIQDIIHKDNTERANNIIKLKGEIEKSEKELSEYVEKKEKEIATSRVNLESLRNKAKEHMELKAIINDENRVSKLQEEYIESEAERIKTKRKRDTEELEKRVKALNECNAKKQEVSPESEEEEERFW